MSRIPELMDKSSDAMFLWWKQMATAGLAFHPDDPPEDVVGKDGKPLFSPDEAQEVGEIVYTLHTLHGDRIYTAALLHTDTLQANTRQATETPDITAAREHALNHWNDTDVQISPDAAVEKALNGYWVAARVWVPEQ